MFPGVSFLGISFHIRSQGDTASSTTDKAGRLTDALPFIGPTGCFFCPICGRTRVSVCGRPTYLCASIYITVYLSVSVPVFLFIYLAV